VEIIFINRKTFYGYDYDRKKNGGLRHMSFFASGKRKLELRLDDFELHDGDISLHANGIRKPGNIQEDPSS